MKILKSTISLLLAVVISASLLFVSVFASNGYSIIVDGTSFDSGSDSAGTGWNYSSDLKTLTLNSYNGGPIVSKGDINIIIAGNTTISGVTSVEYNAACCGISVTGSLIVSIDNNADVKITGADNAYSRGGDGIVANSLVISSSAPDSVVISGGNSESEPGGFAIRAGDVVIDTRKLIAKGGNNTSALYFASSFQMKSGTNATFIAGAKYVGAITYLSSAEYSVDSTVRSVYINGSSTAYFSTFGTFMYGDMNNDDAINAMDAVIMAQFMAGWSLDIDEASISAADVFYDGKINAADAVLLAQYLASWSGITLGK